MNPLTIDQMTVILTILSGVFLGIDNFVKKQTLIFINDLLEDFVYKIITNTKYFLKYALRRIWGGFSALWTLFFILLIIFSIPHILKNLHTYNFRDFVYILESIIKYLLGLSLTFIVSILIIYLLITTCILGPFVLLWLIFHLLKLSPKGVLTSVGIILFALNSLMQIYRIFM